jgi:hypothetical protein
MLIEALVSAITLLISAGSVYYSREKALPEIRKRDLCGHLSELLAAIDRIARTGNEIGAQLDTRVYGAGASDRITRLSALLEAQQANLRIAQREFEFLSSVFQVQLPDIGHLYVHLRGKKDRIELIYATTKELQQRPRHLEPWEMSRIVAPLQLRQILARSPFGIEVLRGSSMSWESDPDFSRIIAVIPELRKFVYGYCTPEYLV